MTSAGVLTGQQSSNSNLAIEIERLTSRKVTLETSLAAHLSKCKDQSQSPLFAKLPKEMRDMIFEYTTAQYEDLSRPYPGNAFYYRPGYRAPHKTSAAMLQTCRRIWLEANARPMRQAALTFWFEPSRGPIQYTRYDIGSKWTILNKQNFTILQFFVQKHRLAWLFQRTGTMKDTLEKLQPKVLRVTVRHTDWHRWEDPVPLSLESTWLQNALDAAHMSAVQTLQVELETLINYKDQLDPIVQRLSKLRGKARLLSDGTYAQLLPSPTVYHDWHWTGPTNINNTVEPAHKDMEELNYVVAVLTWKAAPCSATTQGTVSTEVSFSAPRIMFRPHAIMRRMPPTIGDHALRLQLLQGGWENSSFPYANYVVRRDDMENARRTAEDMATRFRRMFADIHVREFEEKWKAEGSLLKFESEG